MDQRMGESIFTFFKHFNYNLDNYYKFFIIIDGFQNVYILYLKIYNQNQMGAIRSLPQNEINVTSESFQDYYYISLSVCGWQYIMQDFQLSLTQTSKKCFLIIDGHNGPQIAQLTLKKFPTLFFQNDLIQKMSQTLTGLETLICQLEQVLFNSHDQLNEIRLKNSLNALTKEQSTRSGCSIVIVVIDEEEGEIVLGNIGPCRCYVTYKRDKSKAILFSGNHLCSNREEEQRIVKNGGFIYNNRINGIYPYTRSIGDFHMKKNIGSSSTSQNPKQKQSILTSEPSLFSLRKQDIQSIIFGSSGFWQQPEKVATYIGQLGQGKQKDEEILQQMVNGLIAKNPKQQKNGIGNISVGFLGFW